MGRKKPEVIDDQGDWQQIPLRIPPKFVGLKDALDQFGEDTLLGRNSAMLIALAKIMRDLGRWEPPNELNFDAMISPMFEDKSN